MVKAQSRPGRVLVTGSEGFIGTSTVKVLSNKYEVIPFDLSQGQDITEESHLRELPHFDYVVHLAAVSSSAWAKANSKEAFNTNVFGTYLLLLECLRRGIKKLVCASSYRIYDLAVSNPYIISKMLEEIVLVKTELPFPVVGLRYTSIYGPGGFNKKPEMNVLNQIVNSALTGSELEIIGDGHQTRDFTYVEDVAHCNKIALEVDIKGVYDVGTGHQHSLNSAIRLVERSTGKRVRVKYTGEYPEDYMMTQESHHSQVLVCPTTLIEGIEKCMR